MEGTVNKTEMIVEEKPLSDSKYRQIFEGLSDACAICSVVDDGDDFVFIDFNKAAERLDSLERDEVIGQSVAEVFPSARTIGFVNVFRKVYKTGKPEKFHVRILNEGTITGWRCIYVYKLPGGEIVSVYSSETKRRRMDQRLLEHRQKLRELTCELSLSEERQRRKIAGNLHDQLSQWLAIASMKLDLLHESVESEIGEELEEVKETIRKAISSVREMIYDLSSPTLYRFGLEAAVFEFVTNLFKKHDEIQCEITAGKKKVELGEDISVLLFQSIRELLFNIIKYAKATYVSVEMKVRGELFEVIVIDNGVGFDVSNIGLNRSGGFGLFHMAEKLDHVGGKLEIDSKPSEGSRFCLQVPYTN